LKRVGTSKSFKNLLKNNNKKLKLLNSFQKFFFDKQSAVPFPGPLLATPLQVRTACKVSNKVFCCSVQYEESTVTILCSLQHGSTQLW